MEKSWITKKVIAWSLYDFADQAFSALFITFFFPILVKVHLGGNEFQIGLSMGFSVLAAALLVPWLGAVSDASGRRLPILITGALLTAILTVIIGYSGLYMALVLAFLANIAHLMAKDVYDAKMPDVAPQEKLGSLSGLGFAFGYLGTIASLAVAYPLLAYFGWESQAGIQAVFVQASLWYIVFSLPLFWGVPDMPLAVTLGIRDSFRQGLERIKYTLKHLYKIPTLKRFLIASFLYNNAMNTVVIFLALFGRESIGLGIKEFFPVFGLMALSSGLGAWSLGRLADRLGSIVLIKSALWVWIGIVTFLIFIQNYASFLAVGLIGGLVFGGIWALNRHVIATLSPQGKLAEFFGYEGLTEKFSGVLGPIIFGYLASFYSYNAALTSILVFFIAGLLIMRKL